MPPGMVAYTVLILAYSQLMTLNVIGDRICRDRFMAEMRNVLFQVQLAEERHEVHGDVVFNQLTNTFVGYWLRVWSIHQGPGENKWTQASKNTPEGVHPVVKKPRRERNDVIKPDDLHIEDVERWTAIPVKQGERPPEGPTTVVIMSYLQHFNLSTDKSRDRDKRLDLLLNFLSGKIKNQVGENILEFRCRTQVGQ